MEESFEDLALLTDFQDHRSVCRLADVHREKVIEFAKLLSVDDRISFIKAIAKLENRVGSIGSVTNLYRLLQIGPDPNAELLDWILRNTNSYWYYARGTKSVTQLDAENARQAEITAIRVASDMERQQQDKGRIAEESTFKLYNAVRRGDVKAVRALLSKGADASVPAPDGSSLLSIAEAAGIQAICDELRSADNSQD